MDSRNVRIRIKIDDGISKKGNYILGHKQPFQRRCSSSFRWLGVIPGRSISPCRLRYVSKSFKEMPKNMLYNDYMQRTLRSAVWRKLNYHLISRIFVLLALGPKHNAFFLLTVA
jgi:hypothetical protein